MSKIAVLNRRTGGMFPASGQDDGKLKTPIAIPRRRPTSQL
jgi:hypothetical protein